MTRRLDPRTVPLTLASQPAGARVTLGGETVTAPFTRDVIQGSTNGIGTATPQTIGGLPYAFASWSNAGARNHTTVVNADTTITANFERSTALKLAGADVIGSNVSARRARQGRGLPHDRHDLRHRDRAEPLPRRDVDGVRPRARPLRRQRRAADDAAGHRAARDPHGRRVEQGPGRPSPASRRARRTGSASSTRPTGPARCAGTTAPAAAAAPSRRAADAGARRAARRRGAPAACGPTARLRRTCSARRPARPRRRCWRSRPRRFVRRDRGRREPGRQDASA